MLQLARATLWCIRLRCGTTVALINYCQHSAIRIIQIKRELRKVPSSTPIHKDPIESLNDLYKWLMAPTTFLVLVAWTYLNYVTQTILNNPSLSRLYPYPITQESLLEGPVLVSFEVLLFVPTLVLFLVTYYIRPGKACLISKISFSGTFLHYYM